MNKIDLGGRQAVVTGAAQGIGFATATRLLDSGAAVAIWDQDADLMRQAAQSREPRQESYPRPVLSEPQGVLPPPARACRHTFPLQ